MRMPQKKKSFELILNVNETKNLLVMIIGCVVDVVFAELKTAIQSNRYEWHSFCLSVVSYRSSSPLYMFRV